MTDNVAVLDGYTEEVSAFGGAYDLSLLIRPGTDLDATFKAWDMDNQEFIRVNGWLFSFTPVSLTPFHVIGIDEQDGNATILAELPTSGDARKWLKAYTSSGDAGGWNLIEVIDTRGECAETLWRWERPDSEQI